MLFFGRRFTAHGAVFYSKVEDAIAQRLAIVDGFERLQYRNTDGFELFGAEAGVRGELEGGTRVFANLTLQDERGETIADYPHWIANAGVSVPVVEDRIFASLRGHAVGMRRGGALTRDQDSYGIVDLVLHARRFPVESAETTVGLYRTLR